MSAESAASAATSQSRAGVRLTDNDPISYPVDVNVKTLLEAGAHFGHQTQKWNPKMLPYIFCAKNGIHIINLDITLERWTRARKFIVDLVSRGGNLLMVGTKVQARDIIQQEAERCGAFFVNTRWLGGTLSNFQTVKHSIERMRKIEELLVQAEDPNSKIRLAKKEKVAMGREVEKLVKSLGGIRNMRRLPQAIFVVDVVKETIAVEEARRLQIPVIALVDTNADPNRIDHAIPCNDDATRALRLTVAAVADAVLEGKAVFDARSPREKEALLGTSEEQRTPNESRRERRAPRGGGDEPAAAESANGASPDTTAAAAS